MMRFSSPIAVFCTLFCAALAPAQDSPVARIIPHRYIVMYRQGAIAPDAEARASRMGVHLVQRHNRFGMTVVQGRPTASASGEMAALAAQPNVERVIPDRIVTGHRMLPVRIPNPRDNRSTLRAQPVLSKRNQGDGPIQAPPPPQDAFYTTTPQGWAVRQIGATGINIGGASAPGAWDRTTGAGVRIAILDSGVDANHPDIAPHLALNMSEVNQTDLPSVCEDGSPQDQTGHGTWAASLAAGVAGGGKVVGVAPDATILNIKVLQRMPGTGSTDALRSRDVRDAHIGKKQVSPLAPSRLGRDDGV